MTTSRRPPAKGRPAPKGRAAPKPRATTKSRAATTKPRAASKGRAPRPGRRLAAGLALSVVLVGFLLFSVFPTRDWLDQRGETQDRREELAQAEAERIRLEKRAEELQTPEAIEEAARRDYNMARPGEQIIRLLPRAVPSVELPDAWPFTGASDWLNR